jgi:exosome complex component RRP46
VGVVGQLIGHVVMDVEVIDDEPLQVETRPIKCELGTITRADGSAEVRQGDTIGEEESRDYHVTSNPLVTCGVYGPVEVRSAREREDKAVIEVSVKGENTLAGPHEHQLELLMSSCCETQLLTHLHPHTAISITLQIMSDKGSVMSCMTHALCLALLDAALPMRGTFSSLTCSFTNDGDMITDPMHDQETSHDTCSSLTYIINRGGDLITSYTTGTFNTQQVIVRSSDTTCICKEVFIIGVISKCIGWIIVTS